MIITVCFIDIEKVTSLSFFIIYVKRIYYIYRIHYINAFDFVIYLPSLSPSQFVNLPLENKCPVNFHGSKENSADNSLISRPSIVYKCSGWKIATTSLRFPPHLAPFISVSKGWKRARCRGVTSLAQPPVALLGSHLRDRGEIILSRVP